MTTNKENTPMATTETSTAVALVQHLYELLGKGDFTAIRNEILAPDIVWHIPGHNPLAGTKRGTDEVIAWLQLLGGVDYSMSLDYLSGDDVHAVEIHSGHGKFGTWEFDCSNSAMYTIRDGRLAEVQNHTSDQFALDTLYNLAFHFRPLPDRLALD